MHHHYARRLRPRSHYSMGWLPVVAALASRVPRLTNLMTQSPLTAATVKKVGGIDDRRQVPLFARESFQQWMRNHKQHGAAPRGDVMLWPDTFTNYFDPHIAQAAVEVLEAAGFGVVVPRERLCFGLTWISTGQLGVAKRVLRRTVDAVRDHVRRGGLVVGLEPSCTAVFRSDAGELFPRDDDVARLRSQTKTLAELLGGLEGWQPPKLDRRVHVQTHCHHHAIMQFNADRALMNGMGLDVNVLDSGCCGLAGNFGFEIGQYEVSEACAERVLLPAVRAAAPDDVILADGFSCRTQLAQSPANGRNAMHLADLRQAGLHGGDGLL
jgi:Fe-S oxidoreductase